MSPDRESFSAIEEEEESLAVATLLFSSPLLAVPFELKKEKTSQA
jgi:hypothetical protein